MTEIEELREALRVAAAKYAGAMGIEFTSLGFVEKGTAKHLVTAAPVQAVVLNEKNCND